MTDEGKMSRAISKAGAADRLSAVPEKVSEPTHFIASETPLLADEGTYPFRLVHDSFGDPLPTVVTARDSRGEVAAQVHDLCSRLMALKDSVPPRTITVTSASREEGKTTLAVNLAVALSELGGGRVVVVDGDLYAPDVHSLANLTVKTGLNEVLEDGLSLDGNVYETAIPNLDAIPARAIGKESRIDRQLDRSCPELLAMLRKHYAYVIIDTPPVLAGSLACTFGRHSEAVLLVARMEKTPRDVVRRALVVLTDSGSNVVGCVLTHRKHHIPNFIYGLFGSTPYYYGRSRDKTGTKGS
jgi:capsular exopolysaccharide synthesis family protein